jgi:lipoprotein-anchoring transpeptidase ErfK/SrfK
MRYGIALTALLVLAAVACDEDHAKQHAAPRTAPPPVVERVNDLAGRVPPGRRLALRNRPGGRVLARIGARTEFGSPQTLDLALRQGDWVAVRSPALGNKQVGWVPAAALRLKPQFLRIDVDLSRRQLRVVFLRSAPEAPLAEDERRMSVAIGATDTPTPTGEFYVTDKLSGTDFGPYYGCCILALSGRQPNLPEGWSGGDRLAIHGSPTPTWGKAVSNGCLHADEADLRYLMRRVPLGTYVRVHA